jgi:hypothetical protein
VQRAYPLQPAWGSVGQDLGQTATESIRRGMNLDPTLGPRPGYPFTGDGNPGDDVPRWHTEQRRPPNLNPQDLCARAATRGDRRQHASPSH